MASMHDTNARGRAPTEYRLQEYGMTLIPVVAARSGGDWPRRARWQQRRREGAGG